MKLVLLWSIFVVFQITIMIVWPKVIGGLLILLHGMYLLERLIQWAENVQREEGIRK